MARKYSHPDGGYGFDGAGFAMDKASQLGNFLSQHLKNQATQHFATGEQKAAAKKAQELDRSGMNGNTLRGIQAGTEALTMMGAKPEFVEFVERGRRARYDERMKRTQGDILERAGITPSEPSGFTPMVTPAERARDSAAQEMAQQYGGNDMRLALMEKAPGETPEDLVKFYQAQRSAGQDETMKQEMVQYFAQQDAFANSQFGGEKAAQMFVDQNPDVAFREFNKNVPLEVLSRGDEQSLRTSPSTESFGDGEGGMDMSIDMNKAAVMRTYNQDNAYQVHKDATPTQSLKTDLTGLADQPDVNAEKPRMMASPFADANKQVFDLLGIESTYGKDILGEEQLMRLRQRLESIKGTNKGFSYDR